MKRLGELAVSDEGFVFDPATGESFTCNRVGLAVLRGLKDGRSACDIAAALTTAFAVELAEAQRDVQDFVDQLRSLRLA